MFHTLREVRKCLNYTQLPYQKKVGCVRLWVTLSLSWWNAGFTIRRWRDHSSPIVLTNPLPSIILRPLSCRWFFVAIPFLFNRISLKTSGSVIVNTGSGPSHHKYCLPADCESLPTLMCAGLLWALFSIGYLIKYMARFEVKSLHQKHMW